MLANDHKAFYATLLDMMLTGDINGSCSGILWCKTTSFHPTSTQVPSMNPSHLHTLSSPPIFPTLQPSKIAVPLRILSKIPSRLPRTRPGFLLRHSTGTCI